MVGMGSGIEKKINLYSCLNILCISNKYRLFTKLKNIYQKIIEGTSYYLLLPHLPSPSAEQRGASLRKQPWAVTTPSAHPSA